MTKFCGCDRGPSGQRQSASFQDARYGAGVRVHTVSKTGDTRCTVCGKVTSADKKAAAKVAAPAKK